MHTPMFSRASRFLTALLIAVCAVAAQSDSPSPIAGGELPAAIVVAQDAPTAENVPPASVSSAESLQPVEPPGMTNRALAFWGVAFMLTVCIAFSALGGYAIYTGHGGKKKLPSGGGHDKDTAASA